MTEKDILKIKNLRHALHQIPELAFQEKKTKEMLIRFLKENTDLEIADQGPWFYAFYSAEENTVTNAGKNSREATKTIAFRADFDAVCGKDGKAGHFCGHDGHASILAGLAMEISRCKPKNNVLLIFQPAEETGQGAVLCREILKEKKVSEIYGFHNIPGFPEKSVLLLNGTFACASTGLEIAITGTPSHAAYPELGKNPADVIASLILKRTEYLKENKGLSQITVIGVDLGSAAYGVSASKGILRLTVRAEYGMEFDHLVQQISDDAKEMSEAAGMTCSIRKIEEFPATENDPACVEKVKMAAQKLGLLTITPTEPFRWSEDFGAYLQVIPGAFYGIGDGENWPGLHTESYEFADHILETAIHLFLEILSDSAQS